MTRLLIILGLMTATGCLEEFEPDVGDPLRVACTDEDSDPDEDVSYDQDVYEAIFENSQLPCLDCHAPDAPTPLGYEVGGLDLSSYATMRVGGTIGGNDVVVPGRPCESVLYLKVSEGPPFGARMPLDGGPFVPEDDRQRLHDWIAEGALDN